MGKRAPEFFLKRDRKREAKEDLREKDDLRVTRLAEGMRDKVLHAGQRSCPLSVFKGMIRRQERDARLQALAE